MRLVLLDQELLKQLGVHVSETAWAGTDFDAVLDNNGSLDHLYTQITDLVQGLLLAKANPGAEFQ